MFSLLMLLTFCNVCDAFGEPHWGRNSTVFVPVLICWVTAFLWWSGAVSGAVWKYTKVAQTHYCSTVAL